jgi:hypothetical protein
MQSRRRMIMFTTLALLPLLGAVAAMRSTGTHATQAAPEVVRARAIELVDAGGHVRAQLTVESDGEVVFRLRDPAGAVRVKLGASEDGSGLVLANEATEPGVHILATRAGTSLTLQRGDERRVIRP